MKKLLFFALVLTNLSLITAAQTTEQRNDCKCVYPFKPDCADYCIRTLLSNDKFKETMKKVRLADSTRLKLESWSRSNDNRTAESVLSRRELAKLNVALQTYSDDPANRELDKSRFLHSLGATISMLFGKDEFSNSFSLSQTNICYFPRINITQGESSSLSVGAPVGVGIGIATSTIGGDAGVAFAYDLPIVVDYNFGCKATRNVQKNFGGYVGAGFGYYNVSISQSAFSDFSGSTYGPMGRAGIRFSRDDWNGKAVTIGLFYKKGLEDAKLHTVGFNVLADF